MDETNLSNYYIVVAVPVGPEKKRAGRRTIRPQSTVFSLQWDHCSGSKAGNAEVPQ